MSSITEKNPFCNPIEMSSTLIPITEKYCCLAALFALLTTKPVTTITRSESKVWLSKTDTTNVFSCPNRIGGKCGLISKCIPEGGQIVIDGGNIWAFLNE
jgi:hypothetical protein